jgi:hypothetical protein
METLVELVVQAVLLVAAFKLWRWARKQKRASQTKWRRRFGLLLFLAPIMAIFGRMFLPETLQMPIAALLWINDTLSSLLNTLLGVAEENASGIWLIAIKPLCYAAVYGGAGFLIGWPLDRWAAKRAPAEAAKDGDDLGSDLPQDDGFRG